MNKIVGGKIFLRFLIVANLGIWRSDESRSFTKVYPSLIMAVFTLETFDHPSWKNRLVGKSTDDWKTFQCLNIELNNKTGALFLVFNCCEDTF